jgi:ribosomal protein S18 acetylase RimI-like enzyme
VRIEILEESAGTLGEYSRVPVAFRVERRYRVVPVDGGLGGLMLVEELVAPYVKDYDATGNAPSGWIDRWNMSDWGIFSAYKGTKRAGGAVVAWKTAELVLTGNPTESAVLWDLRVDPACRGSGVGWMLFTRALAWARSRSCRRLEAETQNTNVPACRFYARQGCELVAIDRHAYKNEIDEVRLVWVKTL